MKRAPCMPPRSKRRTCRWYSLRRMNKNHIREIHCKSEAVQGLPWCGRHSRSAIAAELRDITRYKLRIKKIRKALRRAGIPDGLKR